MSRIFPRIEELTWYVIVISCIFVSLYFFAQNHLQTLKVEVSVVPQADLSSEEKDYSIVVSYGLQSWKVLTYLFSIIFYNRVLIFPTQINHSLNDFIALASKLRSEIPDEGFPTLPEDPSTINEQILQPYLGGAIDHLKEDLWHTEGIMSFLDEEPNKSYLTQVQLKKMSKQVRHNVYLYYIFIL